MVSRIGGLWRSPYAGVALGLVVMLIGGVLGAATLANYRSASDAKPLGFDTMGQITKRTKVDLSGGGWNCPTLEHKKVGSSWQTYVALNNNNRSTVVLVMFDGQKACNQLPNNGVTGDLYPMTDEVRLSNQAQTAGYPAAATYWVLCEYCDSDSMPNVLTGVVMPLVLVLGGMAIAITSFSRVRPASARPGTS